MGWGHIRKVVQTPGMHSIAGPHLCPFPLLSYTHFSPPLLQLIALETKTPTVVRVGSYSSGKRSLT